MFQFAQQTSNENRSEIQKKFIDQNKKKLESEEGKLRKSYSVGDYVMVKKIIFIDLNILAQRRLLEEKVQNHTSSNSMKSS